MTICDINYNEPYKRKKKQEIKKRTKIIHKFHGNN